jgi:hypothetical protein
MAATAGSNGLAALRKTVARSKAGQLVVNPDPLARASSARPAPRSAKGSAAGEEEQQEQDRIRRALEAKAKKYERLMAGNSVLVPAGALVDFEEKTGMRLDFADGEDVRQQDKFDDVRSRAGAAFAPPDVLLQDTVLVGDDDGQARAAERRGRRQREEDDELSREQPSNKQTRWGPPVPQDDASDRRVRDRRRRDSSPPGRAPPPRRVDEFGRDVPPDDVR